MSTNKPDEVVSVEYTKGASRIRKSGQKAQSPKTKKTKGKKYTENKDRARRSPLKTGETQLFRNVKLPFH